MEAVMRSLTSRSSKPVRAVTHGGHEGRFEAELKDFAGWAEASIGYFGANWQAGGGRIEQIAGPGCYATGGNANEPG